MVQHPGCGLEHARPPAGRGAAGAAPGAPGNLPGLLRLLRGGRLPELHEALQLVDQSRREREREGEREGERERERERGEWVRYIREKEREFTHKVQTIDDSVNMRYCMCYRVLIFDASTDNK